MLNQRWVGSTGYGKCSSIHETFDMLSQVLEQRKHYQNGSINLLARESRDPRFPVFRTAPQIVVPEIPMSLIPILYNNSGIVCIDSSGEAFRAGWVGSSGCGKSSSVHQMIEQLRLRQDYNVYIANDSQNETYTWNRPGNDFTGIYSRLNLYGTKFFPAKHRFEVDSIKPAFTCEGEKQPANKILWQLSFDDIISEPRFWPDILGITTDTVRRGLEIVVRKARKKKNIKFLIEAIEKSSLMTEGIKRNILSKITSTYEAGIIGEDKPLDFNCLFHGKVLALDTSEMVDEDYIGSKMAHIALPLKIIFDTQRMRRVSGKARRITVFTDEIDAIYSSTKNWNSAAMYEAKHAKRGRLNEICPLWASQRYSVVNRNLRNETSYLFVFNIVNRDERRTLLKDRNKDPRQYEPELENLRKFECIVFGAETGGANPFQLISLKTNNIFPAGYTAKGFALPPLSHHGKIITNQRREQNDDKK